MLFLTLLHSFSVQRRINCIRYVKVMKVHFNPYYKVRSTKGYALYIHDIVNDGDLAFNLTNKNPYP